MGGYEIDHRYRHRLGALGHHRRRRRRLGVGHRLYYRRCRGLIRGLSGRGREGQRVPRGDKDDRYRRGVSSESIFRYP